MSDIKKAVEQLPEPSKSISKILIDFYETMKSLEGNKMRGGLQATQIIMTTSDIEKLIENKK